jgi:hypothetical protein
VQDKPSETVCKDKRGKCGSDPKRMAEIGMQPWKCSKRKVGRETNKVDKGAAFGRLPKKSDCQTGRGLTCKCKI